MLPLVTGSTQSHGLHWPIGSPAVFARPQLRRPDSQRGEPLVRARVVTGFHNLQVFRTVIALVVVPVMYDLILCKWTPKRLLSYGAMFFDRAGAAVTVAVEVTFRLAQTVVATLRRAVFATSFEAPESRSALGTGKLKRHRKLTPFGDTLRAATTAPQHSLCVQFIRMDS